MAKPPILKAKGLFTHPNLLSEVPEGALVVADEVVIDREGVIQPRRGFSALAGAAGGTINRITEYQDKLILHHGTGTIAYRNGSVWTDLSGTFAPPSTTTAKTRFAQANQNLYFTTSAGVKKMATYATAPIAAGAPRAIGFRRPQFVNTAAIAGIARTAPDALHPAGVVTVTLPNAHNFYIGQWVKMTSAGEANFSALVEKQVVTIPSSVSFTYDEAGAVAANGTAQTFVHAALIGSSGFMADGSQAAYRYCFNAPDANNTTNLSYVSPRYVVANVTGTPGWVTAVARNVIVRCYIPSTCTTTMKIRLCRSRTCVSTIEPSDELFQVWEAPLKTIDITRGWVDIEDIATDALLGPTLYTSPSQESLAQNNYPPPNCKDICSFDGGVLFANTTDRHRLTATLLGVGGSRGLASGDIININQRGYTAATTCEEGLSVSSRKFIIATGGASAGVDIRNTALNLISAINDDTGATVTAYYGSLVDELPGQIVIEADSLGGSPFGFIVQGRRLCWSPLADTAVGGAYFDLARTGTTVTATLSAGTVPYFVGETLLLTPGDANFASANYVVTAVTATTLTYTDTASGVATLGVQGLVHPTFQTSVAESNPHRIYRAKRGYPEAVPLLNYDDVGTKDADILKTVALREGSVFIFKEDGLYRKAGYDATPKLFDPTIILLAPDSVQTLGNQIYAFTNQGVLAISETGSEVVSRPIEKTLLALQGLSLTNLKNLTFGVSYESERKYFLWTIASANDTVPTVAYVYNAATDAWTKTTQTRGHGVVSPSVDKLYLVNSTTVYQERKSFNYTDYSDADITVTINSVSGLGLTLASVSGLTAGDIITRGGVTSRINLINGSVVTVDEGTFTTGAATVYVSYQTVVQWAPQTGGAPGIAKHWQETKVLLGNAHIPICSISTFTDQVRTFEDVFVNGIATIGQWVNAATTWDGTERPFNLRVPVPREMSRSARLNVKWGVRAAWGVWSIDGLALRYEGGGEGESR